MNKGIIVEYFRTDSSRQCIFLADSYLIENEFEKRQELLNIAKKELKSKQSNKRVIHELVFKKNLKGGTNGEVI